MRTTSPQRRKKSSAYRKRRYSTRAFYLSILVVCSLATLSVLAHGSRRSPPEIDAGKQPFRRGIEYSTRHGDNVECRMVHKAQDKCTFVKANCPDEEAGLLSYLQLYFCKLPTLKPLAFAALVIWLGLLFSTIGIAASDFFCINLSTIATIFGMSESMAGVTFLAFGNGSPDVFSTFAAIRTHSGSLAVGELIGAAGFITAVVAGSMALVRPFRVARKSFVRDIGFFIVATSFSIVFIADGHLTIWECAVMVAFYLFYVLTVVAWHWYLGHVRRRRHREVLACDQFHGPEDEEIHQQDEHDVAVVPKRLSIQVCTGNSVDDFAALESSGSPFVSKDEEDENNDDETRERWMAEISSNMRLSRPARGEQRNATNPIRPSLVGALEFRTVLFSLHKSRNHQTVPMSLRRYSDDPTFTLAQQQENSSTDSNFAVDRFRQSPLRATTSDTGRPIFDDCRGLTRARAVSANDVLMLCNDQRTMPGPGTPHIDLLGSTPPETAKLQVPHVPQSRSTNPTSNGNPSFQHYLSSSPDDTDDILTASKYSPKVTRSIHLALPDNGPPNFDMQALGPDRSLRSPSLKPLKQPISHQYSRSSTLHSHSTAGSSPATPFPTYYDDSEALSRSSRAPSIRLPPPSIDPDDLYNGQDLIELPPNRVRWWPYKSLPPPKVIASTLFPTLYSWRDKNIGERLLAIVAAPSVFLLVITLPVVDIGKDEITENNNPGEAFLDSSNTALSSGTETTTHLEISNRVISEESSDACSKSPPNHGQDDNYGSAIPEIDITGRGSIDNETVRQIGNLERHLTSPLPDYRKSSQQPISPTAALDSPLSSPKEWHRWLVATQIVTAPIFVVLIIWANSSPIVDVQSLFHFCLYSLVGSLVVLAVVFMTTDASKPPRYRLVLCFLGFVVSIAWISTIANEVVGVLKALGVILEISDAILGLTIFAVGNSLGDLVADITIAKLGHPVMALSACFGGPMLNILLGIGLSGLYMTIHDGNGRHERHPQRPIKYTPYQIEVGGSLIISCVTLLITLVSLLVVVPWNKWVMDRKIGWGLIILWSLSTLGNVAVEVCGLSDRTT